jgi:hypothetical protein
LLLLEERILVKFDEPIRYSPELEAGLRDLARSVKAHCLEGLVAQRRNSGGYTVGGSTFDALIFGHYDGANLFKQRARATASHPECARN